VSGHPVRNDISQMLDWVRPVSAIPVHGERVQMEAHADLAREKQIKHVRVGMNGEMLRITQDGLYPEHIYPLHFQAINFDHIVPADHIAILERRKMSFNGAVFVSVVADRENGDVLDVRVSAIGLLDPDDHNDARTLTELEDAAADRFEALSRKERLSEDAAIEAVRASVKRFFRELHDIKPLVNVHISLV
jgi:ribonuclease J